MRYYIIAGEASGDLHGSNLIKQIKKLDAEAVIRCWGGDLMQQAGANVVKHYRELAFMGFLEVVKNLPAILRNIRFSKADILSFQPDVLVLIDYPGFNLRIAAWARPHKLKTVYYISPQVWAWKENRVKKIRNTVDKMLVILPFEKDFYKKWQYDVQYVGHPLVEVVEDARQTPKVYFGERPVIALLPGSRQQEIHKKLPVMLAVTTFFPDYQFVVARAPGLDDAFYHSFLGPYNNVSAVTGKTYALLQQSVAALVTSGTATLETALFGVPEVVCYKSSNISYQIGKRLIKVKYISLVNLIMDKLVVKELIQHDLTPENLKKELADLLFNPIRKEQLLRDYNALREKLQAGGAASSNAAATIVAFTRSGANVF